MGLKAELESKVAEIFRDRWSTREGQKVPEADELLLSNDAVKLQGTALYADLADSTTLVDGNKPHFAAEIYKTFLHCAAKIVRSEGGTVTAYDGDRIMAVYIGKAKNTSAVRTAMKIQWARGEIVNPALKKQYPDSSYSVKGVVGVDTSELFITRTGVRGANDLVWVGRAANYAAKLSALPEEYPIYITERIYSNIADDVKVSTSTGTNMWTKLRWSEFDNSTIYGSTWRWRIN